MDIVTSQMTKPESVVTQKNTFIDDELFPSYHFFKDWRVADSAKLDNGLTDYGRQDSFFFLHGALRPQKP